MTKRTAKKILVTCFKALPKRDRDRLAYHYDKNTPIVCGVDASLYTDGGGGA